VEQGQAGSYECGIEPTPQPLGGARSGQVLPDRDAFIVFDIEIVFLYPWASLQQARLVRLIEMVAFVLTVLIAYAYVWRRGGLEWISSDGH